MLKELKGIGSTYRVQERRRKRRLAKLIIGVCVVLLCICALLGFVYVWYMGKTQPIPQATIVNQVATKSTVSVPVVDEEAPVGVAVQTLTSPVHKGGNSSISIKTRPKAACSIRVTYGTTKNDESKDGGLIPKTADEYGVADWTWTVETSRPVGSWPVEVTCAYKTKWGYGKDILQVID